MKKTVYSLLTALFLLSPFMQVKANDEFSKKRDPLLSFGRTTTEERKVLEELRRHSVRDIPVPQFLVRSKEGEIGRAHV